MSPSSPHYLPLPLPYFSILAVILLALIIVVELRALRFAYRRIGLGSRAAVLVLVASLIGSYFNIPIIQLPARQILGQEQVPFFGMSYVVPVHVEWPGTLIAINVGGAAIPVLVSLYLLATHHLWIRGAIAIACVAAICHMLAYPVPGVGIAMPTLVPPITTAIVALILSQKEAAPLAYIGGSLGALVGADLLNLGKVQGMGAPVASIGGAGTFDGVFLTGVLAVLIASIFSTSNTQRRDSGDTAPLP
jgi:uncharacterized membrane protein